MAIPQEDAAIMFERQRLERFYTDTLTPTQQSDWTAFLASLPPTDASGTQYVTGMPTAFNQTQVTPQTQYAWSQIFGTFRFGTAPLVAPSMAVRPTFTATLPSVRRLEVILGAYSSGSIADVVGLLIYVWGVPPQSTSSAQFNSRPVTAYVPPAFPCAIVITFGIAERYPRVVGESIAASLMAVDLNNMLIASTVYVVGVYAS